MSNQKTFASREVCDLVFYDYATDKPILSVDYANTTTNGLTGESVFAYGGMGHPKRVGFTGDRGGTIAFESQISTMKLYAMVTGGALSTAAKFVKRVELTGETGKLTLPDEDAVAGSLHVYSADDDCGTELEDVSFTGANVTCTNVTAGKQYIAYYMVNKTSGVESLKLKSTSFPKEVKIYGITNIRDESGVDHTFRMICYKALPQPTFDLSFANNGDPSSFTVTFDLETDGNKDMIEYVRED